jgi:hypothetical protein
MDRDESSPALISAEVTGSLFSQFVKSRDLPEFFRLQERNQERVRLLLGVIDMIRQAPTLGEGYQRGSAACGAMRGTSPDQLRRLYAAWRDSKHEWRTLIDQALEIKPFAGMPQEFIDELQLRADANHRSVAAALKMLRADWVKGKEIPGYGTWRTWWTRTKPGRPFPRHCNTYPDGWSTRNLQRKLDASKARRIAQIQGHTAAKKFLPGMKLSRVGSAPGRELMWDDKEHDYFVNSFEHKQAARPIELYCHDYASAYKPFFGLKPKYKDEEGYVKKLTGDMMRLVVAGYFWQHGYHPAGTVNYAEHGTANFADDVRQALFDDTQGLITVSESGFDGKASHAGLYHGRSRGQPGWKASLESGNNNDHNWLGATEGQTGRNVENRPEHLHGMLTHNAQLLESWQWLPVEFREMLQFPLMEIHSFRTRLNEVYHQIACERDHDLEGWEACGNIQQMLDIGGHLISLDEIKTKPADVQQRALVAMQCGLLIPQPVKMNRFEVWQRGRGALRPIHGGTVCRILGSSFAKEIKVQGHEFAFSDDMAGPEELYFFGSVTTPDGAHEELKEGERFEVFVNPFNPSVLFVRNAKGRFLGEAKRQPRAQRLNPDAVTASVREYAINEGRVMSKLIKRQLPNIAKKRNRHKHNAAVITQHDQAKQDFTRRATALLNASTSQTDTTTNNTTDHEINEPAW